MTNSSTKPKDETPVSNGDVPNVLSPQKASSSSNIECTHGEPSETGVVARCLKRRRSSDDDYPTNNYYYSSNNYYFSNNSHYSSHQYYSSSTGHNSSNSHNSSSNNYYFSSSNNNYSSTNNYSSGNNYYFSSSNNNYSSTNDYSSGNNYYFSSSNNNYSSTNDYSSGNNYPSGFFTPEQEEALRNQREKIEHIKTNIKKEDEKIERADACILMFLRWPGLIGHLGSLASTYGEQALQDLLKKIEEENLSVTDPLKKFDLLLTFFTNRRDMNIRIKNLIHQHVLTLKNEMRSESSASSDQNAICKYKY